MLSAAITVTVTIPISEQSADVGVIVTVGTVVQLSVTLATTIAVVSVALPEASKTTSLGDATVVIVGSIRSTTVTVPVCTVVLPLASVAVTVTVFDPRSLQPKLEGLTETVTPLQLSLTLLTTCEVVNEALPLASNASVTPEETSARVGLITSCTVTAIVASLSLPLASVAVTQTFVVPISLQLNEVSL